MDHPPAELPAPSHPDTTLPSRRATKRAPFPTRSLNSYSATFSAILGFAAVVQPTEAKAVNVLDTTNPIHLQLAADLYLKGAAWISYTRPDGTILHASAAQLNEHTFVIATHLLIYEDGSRNSINFSATA